MHTDVVCRALVLQMLHAFMDPVDVEITVQFGGHTEAGSEW